MLNVFVAPEKFGAGSTPLPWSMSRGCGSRIMYPLCLWWQGIKARRRD